MAELIGIKETQRRLNRITRDFTTAKRRQVGRAGARPVIQAARQRVPIRKRQYAGRAVPNPMPKYSRGRLLGQQYAGNLRKSMNTITGLRRTPYVFVGPRKGRASGNFGQSVGSADGYYAQMVYGSAREFRKRILDPAARQAGTDSLKRMERKATDILEKVVKKQGFRFR